MGFKSRFELIRFELFLPGGNPTSGKNPESSTEKGDIHYFYVLDVNNILFVGRGYRSYFPFLTLSGAATHAYSSKLKVQHLIFPRGGGLGKKVYFPPLR